MKISTVVRKARLAGWHVRTYDSGSRAHLRKETGPQREDVSRSWISLHMRRTYDGRIAVTRSTEQVVVTDPFGAAEQLNEWVKEG